MGNDKTQETSEKMSAADFRLYNRCAEHMNYYHNHFRSQWKMLYAAASAGKRPQGMSIRQYIDAGEAFLSQLDMHHSIEEAHIFPIFARKMPAFKAELELLTQHKQIHKGMDAMGDYLKACRAGDTELRMGELKTLMDGFGGVLWQHLDDEVEQLGAENMRKYWTKEEMRKLPM